MRTSIVFNCRLCFKRKFQSKRHVPCLKKNSPHFCVLIWQICVPQKNLGDIFSWIFPRFFTRRTSWEKVHNSMKSLGKTYRYLRLGFFFCVTFGNSTFFQWVQISSQEVFECLGLWFLSSLCRIIPICSMGLVYLPTFRLKYMVHVGKYSIHGASGTMKLSLKARNLWSHVEKFKKSCGENHEKNQGPLIHTDLIHKPMYFLRL